MSKSGVVIGKFMPLHTGHIHMIEFAKNFVDDLTVLVDNLPNGLDTMTLEDRTAIVKKAFPHINVKAIDVPTYQDPSESPDFWEFWRDCIVRNVGKKPDYILGSMDYIKPLADVIGCEFIMNDKARSHVPISATIIRNAIQHYLNGAHEDFFKIKDFIPTVTNDYLTRDIYIVGGESTGKSTLARNLANQLQTIYVNEYAIDYIGEHGRELNEADLLNIARGQLALQKTLRRESNLFCIHDTDLITSKIWHKKFFEKDNSFFEDLISKQKDGFYILLKPTLKWVSEEYRYYEADVDRNWFHEEFKRQLNHYDKKYIEVDVDENLVQSIINNLKNIYEGADYVQKHIEVEADVDEHLKSIKDNLKTFMKGMIMSNENKLHVNYVLCQTPDGLYADHKFRNELDLDEVKKNNGMITTFYDETYPFVNVTSTESKNGNIVTVKNGQFEEITKQELSSNVHLFLQTMINQAHAAEYIDYKRDEYDTSILDSLKSVAEKLEIELTPATQFNKEIYFNAYNGLTENISLNVFSGPDELFKKFRDIRLLAMGLNTFIASEGTIKLEAKDVHYSPNYMIDSYEYEDDDGEMIMNYSFDLTSAKNHVHDTARNLKDERPKPVKKFKM
jgi:HTH-type transcriptional repressor of NAD biosynthesis genes